MTIKRGLLSPLQPPLSIEDIMGTISNCMFVNCTININTSTDVNITGCQFTSEGNRAAININPPKEEEVMLSRKEFRRMLRAKNFDLLPSDFEKQWEDYRMNGEFHCTINPEYKCDFSLAPLPKAVPCMSIQQCVDEYVPKQEGKTPMRYNDNFASANVVTTSAPSDTAVQRDYLLNRLARAESPKDKELYNLFNMEVDNCPKTFKELVDAIKNDKFTIDKKIQKRLDRLEKDDEEVLWYCGPLHGIIWDGKQPDPDGYNDALTAKDQQYRAAKDIIMSGVYADGLKALQDFEAWLPVGKAN